MDDNEEDLSHSEEEENQTAKLTSRSDRLEDMLKNAGKQRKEKMIEKQIIADKIEETKSLDMEEFID